METRSGNCVLEMFYHSATYCGVAHILTRIPPIDHYLKGIWIAKEVGTGYTLAEITGRRENWSSLLCLMRWSVLRRAAPVKARTQVPKFELLTRRNEGLEMILEEELGKLGKDKKKDKKR